MEINKTNKVLHCTSCKNEIEPGQTYGHVPTCETSFVIGANGETEFCKSNGLRIICEQCWDAYHRSSTSIINLPPDHPQKL